MQYDKMSDSELRAAQSAAINSGDLQAINEIENEKYERQMAKVTEQIENYYDRVEHRSNAGWWVFAALLALLASAISFANTVHTTYEIKIDPSVEITQPK